MSFLDKLKVKTENPVDEREPLEIAPQNKENSGFLQLEVDIFQTSSEIIIVAPIPGVKAENVDISIENENDVVTIKGVRDLPELVDEGVNIKQLRTECEWGPFYRQIILPQEINVPEVEAKFKKGVLVLHLPLLRLQNGKKKIVINDD